MSKHYNVIIIGAGAAGLMAAAQAGKRGKTVLLIEHSDKIGEKIRISGGGRCNFTNLNITPQSYLSDNTHFVKSALSRYTQHDFIKLVESYNIAYHEKTLGQLFCDSSSKQIIDMLVNECQTAQVHIQLNCSVESITKSHYFMLDTNLSNYTCESLIIASGGLSIPKLGASDFGYRIAKQFGINIIPHRPALVPLTAAENDFNLCRELSGVSIYSVASYEKIAFKENMLFTHKGLSGPSILQISSYIKSPANESVSLNLSPNLSINELFKTEKNNKALLSSFLKTHFPNRFIDKWLEHSKIEIKKLTDYKMKELEEIANLLHDFKVKLSGTEGYVKAEVTAGGVDTKELSSKTMASTKVPNLYFIGEVVDVTGWLGGYNFQWAWSSGYVAGNDA
jgi:predicted Rossmann fold flavoprotein